MAERPKRKCAEKRSKRNIKAAARNILKDSDESHSYAEDLHLSDEDEEEEEEEVRKLNCNCWQT